jgi:hypothetical protein
MNLLGHESSMSSGWEKRPEKGHTRSGKPASSGEETRISCDDFVVIGVTAHPEPQQTLRYLNSQRPIMQPYADGSVFTGFLEVE